MLQFDKIHGYDRVKWIDNAWILASQTKYSTCYGSASIYDSSLYVMYMNFHFLYISVLLTQKLFENEIYFYYRPCSTGAFKLYDFYHDHFDNTVIIFPVLLQNYKNYIDSR